MRRDKLVVNFMRFVKLAAIALWLRTNSLLHPRSFDGKIRSAHVTSQRRNPALRRTER
jgi:hypothetical protein